MTDKVLCPYCGSEMIGQNVTQVFGVYWAQAKCEHCKSTGPLICGERGLVTDAEEMARKSALSAAQARYLPPNRPLTLDEVKAHCKGGASAMPLLVEFDDGINGWVRIAPKSKGCELEYVSDFVDLMWQQYKKSWRCWLKKPTQEEMDAAGWGEESHENA